MTINLDDLPATLTTHEVAELTRTTADHWWKLARDGTAPLQPLRLGRQLRWPTRPILELLGVDPGTTNGGPYGKAAAVNDPHGASRGDSSPT